MSSVIPDYSHLYKRPNIIRFNEELEKWKTLSIPYIRFSNEIGTCFLQPEEKRYILTLCDKISWDSENRCYVIKR